IVGGGENPAGIDHDGLHGLIEKSSSVPLAAGWHPFRLEWFNATGDAALSLEFEGPGVPRRTLRSADLAANHLSPGILDPQSP
ncbi:MAG: hypothetical protein GY895_15270, partial [Phycisphaera sp.]|nr:hypothetical protein [Phycisphaera sp.]